MGTPNILLLTVDCLRADRLGYMGNADGLTPGLDRLARAGIYFTNAFANGPKTVESFPSILTSTYPFQFSDSCVLSEHRVSLAEVLRDAGFHTAAFGSNPHLSAKRNHSKGFEHFEEFGKQAGGIRARGIRKALETFGKRSRMRRVLRRIYRGTTGYSHVPYVRAQNMNKAVLGYARSIPQPFFLWIHYMDPHQPYAPVPEYMPVPPGELKRLLVKLGNNPEGITPEELTLVEKIYDAEVHYQDRYTSLLLEGLGALGLLDDLLVVVTADHGEEFREHGDFFHATMSAEHKAKLYRELVHVPWIVWDSKNRLPSGKGIDQMVSLADLAPTLIDWLGLEEPASWVGTSLLPTIQDGRPLEREGVFAQQALKDPDPSRPGALALAYRSRRWTFIHNGILGQNELYDRIGDPGETANLYHSQVDVAQRLESKMAEHIETSVDPECMSGVPMNDDLTTDEDVLERLRGLGYVE